MSSENIYNLCIDKEETETETESISRPRVLSLTRSTQQHCFNCGFCCPEYGLPTCVKCHKETCSICPQSPSSPETNKKSN